ncbi:MAG: DVUA0089 family protein [Planctomycetaceae bacterium]
MLNSLTNWLSNYRKHEACVFGRRTAKRSQANHGALIGESLEDRLLLTIGALDTSFGNGGLQATDFTATGGPADSASAVEVIGSGVHAGKTIVAGQSGLFGVSGAVARYNIDGTLDETFGIGGRVTLGAYNSAGITDVVVLNDAGDLLVTGPVSGGASRGLDFGITRVLANGTIDNSFRGGLATIDFVGGNDTPRSLRLDGNGNILVAGSANFSGTDNDFAVARLLSDGNLDTSFSTDGKQTVLFDLGGGNSDEAFDVALAPDGKIVLAGSAQTAAAGLNIAVVRLQTNGNLDTNFSNDGKHNFDFGQNNDDQALSVVINANKIIVGGWTTQGTAGNQFDDFALARLNDNGTPDLTFSSDGLQTTDFVLGGNPSSDRIRSLDVVNGSIIAAGFSANVKSGNLNDNGVESGFALARYSLTDGSLDTGIGTAGRILTDFFTYPQSRAAAIDIGSTGKVTVVGFAGAAANLQSNFAVARYTSTATAVELDNTFGNGGRVVTDFTDLGGTRDTAKAVQVIGNGVNAGKLIVVGETFLFSSQGAVARYNANGSLDTTFGVGGRLVLSNFNSAGITDVRILSDGDIVVAGGVTRFGNTDIGVTRLNENGTVDAGFGGGLVTFDIGLNDVPEAIEIDSSNRVLVGGFTDVNGSNDFVALRLQSDGNVDTTFNTTGAFPGAQIIPFDLGSQNDDRAHDIIVQADGKIVLAGSAEVTGSRKDFALVRLQTNGAPDGNFGANGKLNRDFGNNSDDEAFSVVTTGSTIVAGGYTTRFVGGGISGTGAVAEIEAGNNSIFDAQSLDGIPWSLTANPNIGDKAGVDTSTTIPHVTITGAGDGNFDYYSFTVDSENARGIFDIDTTNGWDTELFLYDAAGNPMLNGAGDDSAVTAGRGGSTSGFDSFIEFIFPAPGTYVVGVSKFNSDQTPFGITGTPPAAGNTYQLQVSIEGKNITEDFALASFNISNGNLNISFDGDGLQTTDFNPGGLSNDRIQGLQFDNGNIIAAGFSQQTGLSNPTSSFAVARYGAASGTLDNSIGTAGRVATSFFTYPQSRGGAIEIVGTGAAAKLVVAGAAGLNLQSTNFALARYSATNASLDLGFSDDGLASSDFTDLGGSRDIATTVEAVQSDGSLFVAGQTQLFGVEGAVAKYTAAGILDPTFGVGGRITVGAFNLAGISDLKVLPNGKILITGPVDTLAGPGIQQDFGLMQLNPDGSIDKSFRNGLATVGFFGSSDIPTSIAVQTDGKILVAGYARNGANDDFAIARFQADGNLDTSFNTTGRQTVAFNLGGSNNDRAYDVQLAADGRILLGGSAATAASGLDFAVARLQTNGQLDTNFDADGKQTRDLGNNTNDEAFSLLIQPDNKIVAGGYSTRNSAVATLGTVLEVEPNNLIGDPQNLDDDRWSLIDNPNIGDSTNTNTSTTIPYIQVVGFGDGSFDYYSFTVANAGDRGIFDIDFSNNIDTEIFLYDAAGNLLFSNDDSFPAAGVGRGGSTEGTDSFLDINFPAAGTYVIGVGQFNSFDLGGGAGIGGSTPDPGDSYVLNISIQNHGNTAAVTEDFGLLRLNENGSPDITFNSNGINRTDFAQGNETDDRIAEIRLQDNKIVAVGYTLVPSNQLTNTTAKADFAMAQYSTATGTLDTSLGTAGRITQTFFTYQQSRGGALDLDASGRWVAAGFIGENASQQTNFAIARFDGPTPPPTVTLSVSNPTISENGGVATFTATLSTPAPAGGVTVALAFSGDATDTADYIKSGTQIVIAAGATEGTVIVTAQADTVADPDEKVTVTITSAQGATIAGSPVTVTIFEAPAAPPGDMDGDGQVTTQDGNLVTLILLGASDSTLELLKTPGSTANAAHMRASFESNKAKLDVDKNGSTQSQDGNLIVLVKLGASDSILELLRGPANTPDTRNNATQIKTFVQNLGAAPAAFASGFAAAVAYAPVKSTGSSVPVASTAINLFSSSAAAEALIVIETEEDDFEHSEQENVEIRPVSDFPWLDLAPEMLTDNSEDVSDVFFESLQDDNVLLQAL